MCSRKILERVNHKPILIESPKNVTVLHGEDVNFTCKYLSDLHLNLAWFTNTNESVIQVFD